MSILTFHSLRLTHIFYRGTRYVAVKILRADISFDEMANDELMFLRKTRDHDPQHPGYKHVIQMFEDFYVKSKAGIHKCITFELMGSSLLDLLAKSNYNGIKIDGVRKIVKQVRE